MSPGCGPGPGVRAQEALIARGTKCGCFLLWRDRWHECSKNNFVSNRGAPRACRLSLGEAEILSACKPALNTSGE